MITWGELLVSTELGLIFSILAFGIFLTFRVLRCADMTCDGSLVLGAATCTMLTIQGFSGYICFLCATLMGFCAGCFTGVLHVFFNMRILLAGILVSFMLYSVNLMVMGGAPNIPLLQESTYFSVCNGNIMGSLPILLAFVIPLWSLLGYALNSRFGLAMRSIGVNSALASRYGIPPKIFTVLGLALSNGLIALCGALFCQHQGFSDINQGVGTLVVGLASIMLGEVLWNTSSLYLQLIQCVLGSICYRVLTAVALHGHHIGLETQHLNLLTGVMIIIIVSLKRKEYALLS